MFLAVYLMFQLKKAVIEEFDGILPKLGVVNWENVLEDANFVKRWQCFLWAKAFIPCGGWGRHHLQNPQFY